MRRAIWVLAMAVLCGPAVMADETNLSGGAFITHYDPAIPYSTDAPAEGWCGAYAAHALTSWEQSGVRVDGPAQFVWYVLAAWSEPKRFCGVQFGFDDYDETVWAFLEVEPCYPDAGVQLPTENWPGPNEGVALVTTSANWVGNYIPVYKFSGYAYASSYGTTLVAIRDYAAGATVDPFCGFSNCLNPPQEYAVPANEGLDTRRGAMGVNTAGVQGKPNLDPVAVCCVETACFIRTEADCADLGGEWHALWDVCEPNPCDPLHACCYGSTTLSCAVNTQSTCLALPNGVWHLEWDTCDPNPCKDAACCTGEVCSIATELECLSGGGDFWLETSESCAPNPCQTFVCCVADQPCQNLSELDCAAIPGSTWHEGYKCNDSFVDCDALGACCFEPPANPTCVLMWEQECLDHHPEVEEFTPGDIWHPTRDCSGNNVCYPVDVEDSSWGRIKRLYQ